MDNLLIESKFVRGATTPSKITEGIAADMTKAPSDMGLMFVVYDPEHQIPDDKQFARALKENVKIVSSEYIDNEANSPSICVSSHLAVGKLSSAA